MMNEKKKGDYKNVARVYDILIEPLIKGIKRKAIALHPISEESQVLDIGCGTGSLLKYYQAYSNRLSGVDLSPSMISVARGKLGDSAILKNVNATELPFEDNTFDLVTCSMFLHEIKPTTRLAVLNEAKRVIKKTGLILVIDYHVSPTLTIYGKIVKSVINLFEFMAGGDHFRNYRQFIKSGGIASLIAPANLTIKKQRTVQGRNFGIYLLQP